MSESRAERELAGIAPLVDTVRRRLYFLVASRTGEVTREEAARALGISRPAATFHLEKLVEEGLLEADYRRVSGRRGPGAGRPARVYRGPAREIRVQIPARDYELMARLLLEGLGEKEMGTPKGALETAREFGTSIGSQARGRAGKRPNSDRLVRTLTRVLRDRGFEPQSGDVELRLGNCPFHALSRDYRDVVCPMNLSMMKGVLEGLRARNVEAVLDPQPGMCCVAFRAKKPASRHPRVTAQTDPEGGDAPDPLRRVRPTT
jgi:predicted ArsR family transcriptional regulator